MPQPSPVPATPFAERLRTAAGRRTLGLSLALLIEALLLLLLLSLGVTEQPGARDKGIKVVNLAPEASEEAEEPSPEEKKAEPEQPEPEQQRAPPRPDEPLPPQPVEPAPQPIAPPVAPSPIAPPPAASAPPSPVRPASPARPVYGPPDRGRPASSRDTERVGTAPNGEPLYAAAWYREPRDEALRAYLSTASGPGWGLIACRTASEYRVEDCVGLEEYPQGSQITRAVLAAAWEFKVRPPRVGGRYLVGSWVRIRIDYDIKRR